MSLEAVCQQKAYGLSQSWPIQRLSGRIYRPDFSLLLLLVWLLQTILVNLSFVEGLRLPNIPFTMAQIITFIAYLIAFMLAAHLC
jgi:uncharacterized membrane protein YhaH (DUF805 family)